MNEGFKPGVHVHAFLFICFNNEKLQIEYEDYGPKINIKNQGVLIKEHSNQLEALGLSEHIKKFNYSGILSLARDHPDDSDYAYPFAPVTVTQSTLTIDRKDFEISIISLIYEETMLTIQITSRTFN